MEPSTRPNLVIRVVLSIVAWFSLLASLAGAIGLTFGGGMGVPLDWLDGTPFTSFFWPAVILGVVVGGSQLLALVAQYARVRLAWGLHAAAGLVMLTWIFIEIALLLEWAPLQGIFFTAGIIQVAVALLALGAWPHPVLRRDELAREPKVAPNVEPHQ